MTKPHWIDVPTDEQLSDIIIDISSHSYLASQNRLLLSMAYELLEARKALRPFAAMADGKDSWKQDTHCCQFPKMTIVRKARDVVNLGKGPDSDV